MKLLIRFLSKSGRTYHNIEETKDAEPTTYFLNIMDNLKKVGFTCAYDESKELVVINSEVIENISFNFIDDIKKQ
ncbi:MAG: hypothetical protein HQK52_16880 [Oligoflexia bacterium]|nr:hypothetical protein [Oligoflexia bacterium]